jgi:hypothetical protein
MFYLHKSKYRKERYWVESSQESLQNVNYTSAKMVYIIAKISFWEA